MIPEKVLMFTSPKEFILLYLGLYTEEYGNKKMMEIVQRINGSSKIDEFIKRIRNEHLSPGSKGFISVTNGIPYFFFAKSETLACGALSGILKWLTLSTEDEFQLGYYRINQIIFETLKISKVSKINRTYPTFFDKFYDLVNLNIVSVYNNFEDDVNSKQDNEWDNSEHLNKITDNLELFIKKFFVPDRISKNTFLGNFALCVYEDANQLTEDNLSNLDNNALTPSKTYMQKIYRNYNSAIILIPIHKEFVCAYPDVSLWLQDTKVFGKLENDFEERGKICFDKAGMFSLEFYRYVIGEYKKIFGVLECGLKN